MRKTAFFARVKHLHCAHKSGVTSRGGSWKRLSFPQKCVSTPRLAISEALVAVKER